MLEIGVIGSSEFTLGFRLAGISTMVTIEEEDNVEEKFLQFFKQEGMGIIITSKDVINKLSQDTADLAQSSVSPVTVVVSEENEMGNLRESIKKAIGVDVWK